MLSSVLLFLFISCSLVSVSCDQVSLFQPLLASGIEWQSCTLIGSGYPVLWVYNPENETITLGVSSSTSGYVAVGFNPNDYMYETDVMIGRFDNGEPTVDDYWINDYQSCVNGEGVCTDDHVGGTNNKPQLYAAGRSDEGTYFIYNRYRIGPDSNYDHTIPVDEEFQLVWAVGYSDEVSYHQARGVSSFYLDNDVNICPNDCSGNGTCLGSCCICDVGFLGSDCSLNDPEIFEFGEAYVDEDDYQFGGRLDDNMHFYWNMKKDSGGQLYLDVGIIYHGSTKGWIGFGFSQSDGGHMSPSDTIICSIFKKNETNPNQKNYDVSDKTFLSRDISDTRQDTDLVTSDGVKGEDSIISSNATSEDGHMYCKWRRLLDTGDEFDSIVKNEKMKIIFAYSEDPNWGQHDWKDKGRAKINFYTGEIDLEVNLWVIHGALMFICWGALIPMGSILAKYFKFIGDLWFQTHRIVQTIAILAQTAGFAVVVAAVNREDTSHFTNTHGSLGLAVFIFGSIQPFIGQLADFMFDPNRDMVPIFPDKMHWIFGWTAVVLGVVNIGLGLKFYEAPDYLVILYIIWILLITIAGGFIHFRSRRWESHKELNSPINYDLLR